MLTVCCLLASSVWADLTTYTGKTYNWVAYDNLTATLGQTLPANVTGYAWDDDWIYGRPEHVPSGALVNYDTGVTLGVTMDISRTGYLWVDTTDPQSGGAIFDDVLGASYTGNVIAHNLGTTQTITIAGLDPTKTYTFAGVATTISAHYDSLSTLVLQGADAAVNESVLTADAALNTFPGFGTTDYSTFMSYLEDDLAMWTGIEPGADGTISLLLTSVKIGNREWGPALDAFALAEEDIDDIPEPATMSLLALGGVALLKRRR